MTDVLRLTGEQVFDQTDIARMQCALQNALHALAFAYCENDLPDPVTREELARAIIRLAGRGERSIERLSAHALRALPPRVAYWARGEERRAIA